MADIQNFRLTPDNCILIVIDVQKKLMDAMPDGIRGRTVSCIQVLIEASKRLRFPVLVSEQYPKGLGVTVEDIAGLIPEFSPFEKITFSCTGTEKFANRIRELGRSTILLTGCETHVCCYQTALDLMEQGFIVHSVADALSSRQKLNWRMGLAALERAGAIPTTTEQALFDLLRVAGSEDFKALSRLIK